ncbi:MAG: lysylphosphatidylglycerol synthase transmembrane domain-containing protein [Acidobacteriota bacterium]
MSQADPGRLQAWGRWLLRFAVSAGLLGLVISRTEAERFGLLLASTNWSWWVLGLVVVLAAPLAAAQRLRLLLRSLGYRVSLSSVVAVNLEAMFFSLVIPGELLAGVVRWHRVSRHTGDRTGAFTLLAAERLMDWVILAWLAAAGAHLLFAGDSAPGLRLTTAAVALAVSIGGGALVLAGRAPASTRLVEDWRRRYDGRTGLWVERLARLLRAGRALTGDGRDTAAVLLWTLVYWSLGMAGSLVMARAIFPTMPLLPYVATMAILALLAQIPLTFAGVGLRELSLPMLLGAYGVTQELGLLIGLSAFVPYAVLGAAGFALRLIGRAGLEETAEQ